MRIIFRPMIAEDWKSVSEIYKQGIETGNSGIANADIANAA
jgi:L-amino acid N-acyltransferase YncA